MRRKREPRGDTGERRRLSRGLGRVPGADTVGNQVLALGPRVVAVLGPGRGVVMISRL